MNGDDKTVIASFSYCPPPPCDPNTDPNCPPPPCDPWTPECGNDPGIIGNPVNSPIVVNLERGGYRLTGKESPVLFDIQASGTPIRIGWTAAGADEAFLCLDRNGSGRIDDGSELFGTATRLKNGLRAPNGFVALAEYDDNHDGVIDEKDQIWPHLLLWRDLNHDGISQSSELTPVAGSDLTSISVDYHWTGRRDAMGNTFRYEAKAWLGKNKETATPEPVYDIFFVHVPYRHANERSLRDKANADLTPYGQNAQILKNLTTGQYICRMLPSSHEPTKQVQELTAPVGDGLHSHTSASAHGPSEGDDTAAATTMNLPLYALTRRNSEM
jgi:hypothetical protein